MSIAKNGGVRLTIGMTDRDIIDRVNALFPCTQIQVVTPQGHKTQYRWRISNAETVREILTLLLPWFGVRRTAKAHEVLAHLDSRVGGIGGYWRSQTHCSREHEFTPENTYSPPGTTYRDCRKCRAIRRDKSRKRAAA